MSIEQIFNGLESLARLCHNQSITSKTKYAHDLWDDMDSVAAEALALLKTHPDAQPNEPLTLEELRNRNKPVFVKVNGFPDRGYWCLCNYGYIVLPNGIVFRAKDRPSWELYDR